MKILVVDDEKPARDELCYILRQYGQQLKIYEASSGFEALKEISEKEPQLVFLDIHLPDLTGLQICELILKQNKSPYIVFVTAYEEHAIKAFQLRAFHYLLKPYDEEEIYKIISEIQKRKSVQGKEGKLPIELEDRIRYFHPNEIYYIYKKKDEKQLSIVTVEGEFTTSCTLQDLEERLKSYEFYRIHKSIIVNSIYIQELQPYFNGTYHIYLKNIKEPLPLSRNYVKQLRQKIEIL